MRWRLYTGWSRPKGANASVLTRRGDGAQGRGGLAAPRGRLARRRTGGTSLARRRGLLGELRPDDRLGRGGLLGGGRGVGVGGQFFALLQAQAAEGPPAGRGADARETGDGQHHGGQAQVQVVAVEQ